MTGETDDEDDAEGGPVIGTGVEMAGGVTAGVDAVLAGSDGM